MNKISTKKIGIITHIKPDGDALGSMCGLGRVLRQQGYEVHLYCDGEIPYHLQFLYQNIAMNDYPISECKVLIAVDCADLARLGKYDTAYMKCRNTINIDHHISNTNFGVQNYVYNSSSASEIVADFLFKKGFNIDVTSATYFYAGILTDTGNFTQSNATPNSLYIASKLLKIGVDIEELGMRLIRMVTKSKLMLIRDAISGMRFFHDDRICLITITMEDLARYNLTINDTEGIINYGINIEGVQIAYCLTQVSSHRYKGSARSTKGIDINQVAQVFGGGGHRQASGFVAEGLYEEIVERLVRHGVLALDE